MKPQPRIRMAALLLWVISLTPPLPGLAGEPLVKEATDFQALQQEMEAKKLPLLLAFRADYCGYCAQLEREYLEPMVKNGNYDNRILIRRFSIDQEGSITNFNGDKINADEFSYQYKASLTPTLVFLNAQGEEVAERLLGYNSPDFYGAYLENSIEIAHQTVSGTKTGEQSSSP